MFFTITYSNIIMMATVIINSLQAVQRFVEIIEYYSNHEQAKFRNLLKPRKTWTDVTPWQFTPTTPTPGIELRNLGLACNRLTSKTLSHIPTAYVQLYHSHLAIFNSFIYCNHNSLLMFLVLDCVLVCLSLIPPIFKLNIQEYGMIL